MPGYPSREMTEIMKALSAAMMLAIMKTVPSTEYLVPSTERAHPIVAQYSVLGTQY